MAELPLLPSWRGEEPDARMYLYAGAFLPSS